MGPMGPMGPGMGGPWGNNAMIGLLFGLVLLAVLGLLAIALFSRGSAATVDRSQPRSAEDVLRARYARGELGRQQYVDALVDILKDRYVRGELELYEYEARLDRLLGEAIGGRRYELEQGE